MTAKPDETSWRVLYGPYHRLESPTQPASVAATQARDGEIFGKAARWSTIPAVKAYRGILPAGARGIEFLTPVPPCPDPHPTLVRWLIDTPGVRVVADGVVAIDAVITRNTQV
jgi:hypothetical protein